MKGGINNLAKILDSSPSPQPSPVKGEGVFLTFYDSISFRSRIFFKSPHLKVTDIKEEGNASISLIIPSERRLLLGL